MKFKPTLLDMLRKRPSLYLRELPDTIRIPALDGSRPDEVVRSLEEATIDDLAFAIQGLEADIRIHHCRLGGLRDLYDLARKNGARGATTIREAFASLGGEGERK
jgi:hypothetical protein